MSAIAVTRQRAVQNRTLVTRGRITEGAIEVLAHAGVQGLTHRAVAREAGVSLAATTYHFDTKADIIEEASRTLLDEYLAAFRRMAGRIATGEETRFANLDDLVGRILSNGLRRDRTRALAWCELILHGGRSPSGRRLAQQWYAELDAIWTEIARLVAPGASSPAASAAIDFTVGLIFMLQPLGLDPAAAVGLISGKRDPEPLLAKLARKQAGVGNVTKAPKRFAETRERLVRAAIDLIASEGAASVSYGRVAEAAGMVRSGPGYYFATIEALLEAAHTALFERAKGRYQEGLGSFDAGEIGGERLLDLTTAIFHREALEFGSENIGHYSVWMRAAQDASLRPAVASSLLDLHRAWVRRIALVSNEAPAPVAMRMQALFIGKVIRSIAALVSVENLSRAREDFAAALHGGTK